MTQHIEEFAGQLRELKERSGRSYGMLATRLHVSTSTLHRYCNGMAVPVEYAPVERFARQCGASAEELVALHRRWLLADAAKRREPRRAFAMEPVQLAPAEGESSAIAATEEGKPLARPASAVREFPAPAVSVEQGPADRGPGGVPPGDHPAAPAAGGRRLGRRARRTTVAAAAAVALAAVLPFVLRSGHGAGGTGASAPLASPAAGAPQRPSPSPSATASAAAAAHAPATASGPAVSTATVTPTASGRHPTGGAPPLQVTVLADNWDTQCDQWFLLRQQPAKVPPPPSLQEGNAWAAALGGIPAGHLRLEVTAQGLPGSPVVLHALYVKVVSSVPAPKGNVYTPADGCGGGIDPASFSVDLDSTTPRAHAVKGAVGNGTTAATVDFPFRISANEPQVLDVDGRTLDRDVRWYMDLVWSSGARQGVLRIDDHGAPFRTTGMKGDPAYAWSSTRWYPSEPAPQ